MLFFLADDGGVVGQELWKSDGTEGGTVLVRDVWPGPVLSGASLLTRVGNQLFFVAEEGVTGRELWRSDGTQAGTRLVGNLVKKGGVSSAPQGLTPTDGTLFFRAEDSAGSELWKSDGTEGGTVRVKDLAPGFRSSTPTDFRRVNGTLYFTAEDELAGRELWKSDGTEGGTVRVKDIFPGPSTSGITSLVDLDGTLFFVASESREGPQIWKSDGTEAGTVRVTNFAGRSGSTSYSYTLFALGKTLFFQFYYDTALGSELWKSDGTEAGTVLVKDIRPGGYPNESSHPSSFTDLGGTLFFAATDTLHGRELWKSDGTAEGTVLVKDLVPGTASSMPAEFFVVGDTLYFQATSPATGMELWKSDGTAEGTMLVKDVWPGVKDSKARPLAGIGGKLFFSAVSSSTSGPEVWVSDGTTEGTTRLMGGLRDATLEHYAVWNGGFAFIAATTAQGPYPSLFWTDGTPGSVRRLLQLPLGWPSVYPRNLAAMGDTLFLSADDDKVGLELWSVLAVPADIKPPVVTCPAAITAEATAIYGTRVTFAATATDDVSASPVLEYSHISGQYFPLGTTRVTATAKDEEGNSASCSFDVTVRDTTPPEIYCSSDQTRVASSPEGSVVVYPPIIVWDVGSSTTTTYTPPSGSLLGLGVTPVTIKAVDTSGNTSTCTFNVTVLPPPPPSITCPRALSVEATSAEGAVVNYGAAVATGMAPVTVSYSQVSGTRFALGTHSVTATAMDGLGQMAACSFSVQVRDTTAPALSCPQDVEVEATSAQGALVAYPPASASDAVSSSTVTYSTPSGATFGLGRTAVTITAQDVAGNTSTCTFNVTVLPPPPPSVTCPPALLAEATSAEGAVVNYEAAVATGLAPVTVSYSQVSGTRFALGTHSVTATAVDGLGQMAACSFAVQVRDTTAPALSCPQDVEAEATSAQGAIVSHPPAIATDVVTASPLLQYSPSGGAPFALGTTPVLVTATDEAGNTESCSFNVVVRDTTAPVLSCPQDVEVEATSAQGALVAYAPASASDAVSSSTVTYSTPSGATFGLGRTAVTVTAQDVAGNTSTCTFNVTVLPPPPPSVTCPLALFAEATSAEGAVVNYGAAVASGLAPVTVSYSQVSGTRFALGTHSVTATAVDGLGQMAACSFAVQVRDTTAPALSCPQDVEAEATSAQGALVAYAPASASDAVSSSTVTYSTPSGATFGLGRTAVTVTAQDVAGNTSTCTFNVTVLPPPPPSVTCPLALFAEATSAEGAVVNYEAAVATGLAPVTVSYSQVSGTRFALGTHSVTATAVDGLGQMAACSFAVQVRDTTAPALSCPQDVEAEATSAQGALVAYAPASASDAVSSSTVTYSTPSGATFGLGRTAITITAQDVAGNTSTCTFNVTVLSPPAPIPDPVEEEPLPPTPVGPAPSGQGCGAGTNTSSGLGWGLVVLLFWSTHRRVRRSQTPLS
ncbi:HYR domain-containing protein [Corallococcus sp. AB045]|uniref:ELWxxDGT repeat protein n=1 Tax=Corallococcus sp. AB045 TaxID=2316719 RepID=UPI000EE3BC2F|nr:ELWxxDGT repeat protein [Corallococcus sp. AB045]RKH89156.1 HYR domain-containing protein [Corallococcus sp. AB045]